MARILITSGPTRQFLDPVRYLTNASSGRMGAACPGGAHRGHDVVVVSGPVLVDYPQQAETIPIVTTDEMLSVCRRVFLECDGLTAPPPRATTPSRVASSRMPTAFAMNRMSVRPDQSSAAAGPCVPSKKA